MMQALRSAVAILKDALALYWPLVRVMVPVMLVTRLAVDLGIVRAVAPALEPVMQLLGLPGELGLAWLTGLLVGIWAGAIALFAIVPPEQLTTAQLSVFIALLLFAHALPIEQRVVQQAGPGMLVTSALRLAGGLVYAGLLHVVFSVTGWLSGPAAPVWVPTSSSPDLATFLVDSAFGLGWMFVILLALVVAIRLLEALGLMARITALLAPVLRRVGIGPAAVPCTTIGLLLGISYGSGLIVREARQGRIGARDLFLACVLMGFSHGLIEDTVLGVAMGGDIWSLLVGRVAFTLLAVAALAALLARISDRTLQRRLFHRPPGGKAAALP